MDLNSRTSSTTFSNLSLNRILICRFNGKITNHHVTIGPKLSIRIFLYHRVFISVSLLSCWNYRLDSDVGLPTYRGAIGIAFGYQNIAKILAMIQMLKNALSFNNENSCRTFWMRLKEASSAFQVSDANIGGLLLSRRTLHLNSSRQLFRPDEKEHKAVLCTENSSFGLLNIRVTSLCPSGSFSVRWRLTPLRLVSLQQS